ncbi:MAG TPA: AI-2E family transporter [Steroidobacteraceae bacterium]|nr:AI-2E family transporter [Steroidobacteraceae bacterium]
MPPTSQFYPRVFALTVAAALAIAVWRIFFPLAGSMAWAAFLAFLLFPLNLRLRRRFSGRRGIAAGVLTILAPIVVLLPLSALSLEFVAQIAILLGKLRATAPALDFASFADLRHIPWLAPAYPWLQAHVSLSAEQIQAWFVATTREMLQRAAAFGGTFFLGALSSLVGIALMLVLLFFFLRDGDALIARARALIPLDDIHKQRLFVQLGAITRAIVFGTTLVALLQGVVLGIGFQIAGLPSPVVFGVVGALLAMLPLGGTILVWVPAALWLFFGGRWGFGIFMVIWGLLLSAVDSILKPLLISGRAEISTLMVFIGVLGGISAFGVIGIIAGPIALSLALALIAFAEEARSRGGASP